MNNEFPIERLKSLTAIQPDPVFLKWSKRAIFANTMPTQRALPRRIRLDEIFTYALRPFAAISALSALIIIAIMTTPSTSPAIASLNGENIIIEQKSLSTETKTAEVNYFKGISPTISLALADIIDPTTDYGSANHIKKGLALLQTRNE